LGISKAAPLVASLAAAIICLALLLGSGVNIAQVAPPALTYPSTATLGSPASITARCVGDGLNFLDCTLVILSGTSTITRVYTYISATVAGVLYVDAYATIVPNTTGVYTINASSYGYNSVTQYTNFTTALMTVITPPPQTTTTATNSSSTSPSSTALPPTSSATSAPSTTKPSKESVSTVALLVIALIVLLILARRGSVARSVSRY